MMRGGLSMVASLMLGVTLASGPVWAETSTPPNGPAMHAAQPNPTDFSAQRRYSRRVPLRLRVYRGLGPSAVRQCRSWYVEEYRPSGTVIVPRMQCWWARG